MSLRNVSLICLLTILVASVSWAAADTAGPNVNRGRFDIRMLGLTVCLVDYGVNKAFLYKEAKDDSGLQLFKTIDLSQAGASRIPYINPGDKRE